MLIRGENAVVVGTPSPYEIRTLSRYLEFRGVERLDALIAADCGEQIHSGLLTLVGDFSPGIVAGPDDDYILSQLERALPGRTVLSTGYARIQVLGDVAVEAAPVTGKVLIQAGRHFILHSGEKYVIMTQEPSSGTTYLSPSDGTSPALMAWRQGFLRETGQAPLAFEPVGSFLFGERRYILKL